MLLLLVEEALMRCGCGYGYDKVKALLPKSVRVSLREGNGFIYNTLKHVLLQLSRKAVVMLQLAELVS